MDEKKLSAEELAQLTQYASRRLGLTPQQIAAAVNEGGLSGLSEQLSGRDAARLNQLLKDPEKTKQLLAMPEIQQLIQSLLSGG